MIKELKKKLNEVYVNPYSHESNCILKYGKEEDAIAICFHEFYIALLPSGKWEQREYENEKVEEEDF